MMFARKSAATLPAAEAPVRKQTARWRPKIWFGGLFAIILVALLLALLNNNFSLRHNPGATFDARLDPALNRAIDWIADHQYSIEPNPSLMFMVSDMERMSHDPRLKSVLDHYESFYLSNPRSPLDFVWFRLVKPKADVPLIHLPDMHGRPIDYIWVAHALAPDKIVLTPADEANLFSRDRWSWGKRQKQLLGTSLYRQFNGSTPEQDATINYLAEKVARDQHFDFRVTDSYIQRNAFVLAARRPDLVRRRWVERILDRQNRDGSWDYCWYGWCRGVFEFGFTQDPGHTTVQAAWMLTMLKYRYPQWIEERRE